MMRWSLLLFSLLGIFLIVSFQGLHAQNFQWAASASGLESGYKFTTADSNNNIIVGGSISVPRKWIRVPNSSDDIKVAVYDGSGENVEVELYKYSDMVMNLSSDGSVNWWVTIESEFNELVGIAHQDGMTALLIMVDDYFYDDDDLPMGYLEDFFGEEPVKHGLHLVFLDSNGKFAGHQTVFENYHAYIDVSDFKAHPSGGFVIAGEAGEGLIAPPYPEAGHGGASILLKLKKEGQPEWMNVVSGKRPATGFPKIAISDIGDIYLGGIQRSGVKYPKGHDLKMTHLSTDAENTEIFDSYIASYSSTGHLKWVTKIGERAMLEDFAIQKNRILAAWMSKTKQSFEKDHSVEEEEQYYFTRLKKNGKVLEEQKTNLARAIFDICPHPNRGFYITQLSREIISPRHIYTVDVYYDSGRKSDLKSQLPSVFGIGEYHPQLQINSKNDLFFVGAVFSGYRTLLSTVDTAFNEAEAKGSAMVVAKMKK